MYTLITGASNGIGYELAKVFAQNNRNLILVARSKDKLIELSEELKNRHGIEVQVLPYDLSLPETPRKIFQECIHSKWNVDILVNNAGFGDHGAFANSAWLKQKEMLQVNITALTELTHLFLPSMLKVNSGRILNVASTAAFQPGPLMSVYYATKAFVLSFSEALKEELSSSGVTVTTLCPGPTTSGFQNAANVKNVMLFETLKLPSSKDVAEYGFEATMKGQGIAVHGAMNKVSAFSSRLMPRTLLLKIVRKLQEKRA